MDSCSICLEELTELSSKIILGCSHKYHLNCIYKNITQGTTHNKCPLCRSKIKMSDSLIKLSEEDIHKIQDIEKQKKEMANCLRPKLRVSFSIYNIVPGEIVQQTRQFFDSFVIEGLEDIDYNENFIIDMARDIYAERIAEVLSDVN
jgi:hypothetical protein